MSTPTPIRIGLIGAGAGSDPYNWANTAHMPYLTNTPHYKIVALCNSSVTSAQAALAYHKLDPAIVKTYGSPEDLAGDANVDMVVVSVNVGKHYALAKPALEAGKDVYVEWPLGVSRAEAEELAELAREKRVRTVVGLQMRPSAVVTKIKEVVSSGRIGRVLSTTARGTFMGYASGKNAIVEKAEYFAEMKNGGNVLTIDFGHFIDGLIFTLGEFENVQSVLVSQYPELELHDVQGNLVKTLPKDTPDHIAVQGTLKTGIVASINYRLAKPLDGNSLCWLISGTDGEIELTFPWAPELDPPGAKFQISNFAEGKVEDVEFDYVDEIKSSLPSMAVNIARVYEAFRKGETEIYASFEDSVVRHRFLEAVIEGSKDGKRMKYKDTY